MITIIAKLIYLYVMRYVYVYVKYAVKRAHLEVWYRYTLLRVRFMSPMQMYRFMQKIGDRK